MPNAMLQVVTVGGHIVPFSPSCPLLGRIDGRRAVEIVSSRIFAYRLKRLKGSTSIRAYMLASSTHHLSQDAALRLLCARFVLRASKVRWERQRTVAPHGTGLKHIEALRHRPGAEMGQD